MLSYLLQRFLSIGLSLLAVSLLVFLMVHLIPGDAAVAILGERATEKALTELRKEMGLDKPLYHQYAKFLWDAAHLDFGRSFKTKQPVVDEIKRYFPATAELTLAAMAFSMLFGIAAGVVAAISRGKFLGLFFDVGIPRRNLNADLLARIDAHSAFFLFSSNITKQWSVGYPLGLRHPNTHRLLPY